MFNSSKTKNLIEFDKFLVELKQKANLENDFMKLGIDIKKEFSNILSGVNILRLSNNSYELNKDSLKKIILS